MAFDGAFLSALKNDIIQAENCHIDKIYQPSREELVISLRKKGFVKKLFISIRQGAARINFTETTPDNPPSPPMFCMLMRKHFLSARLTDVLQTALERVLTLCFEGTNELGDRVNLKIVCEMIGAKPNVVLVGHDGRIIDCLKRSDIETSKRLVAPGAVYEYPESQNKLDPTKCSSEDIIRNVLQKGGKMQSALLTVCDGFSPLLCREIAFLCNADETDGDLDISALSTSIEGITECIKNPVPTMLVKADGTPADFSFTDIKQYGDYYKKVRCADLSELLERFFSERDRHDRIQKRASDVIRLVKNGITRATRRQNNRLLELKATENREQYRIWGELIKANLHLIKGGESEACVQNFYDENLAYIKIPLDPALSAQKNAAKYFKEYKKSYTAEQSLKSLIENDAKEISYLSSVEEGLQLAETLADINEIRDELSAAGYIKQNAKKKQGKSVPAFRECVFEGRKIYIGKNNVQNDYITCTLADKCDMWFHTKNIHGAHVVVKTGGEELPESVIMYAAKLAAANSKAAKSSGVPVDYTLIKNVKKPSGAKPGMVIYKTNKTVFVTPGGEI